MSDSWGSYNLNRVLVMLEQESFFADIGPERTLKFVTRVVELGKEADCTSCDMLSSIGQRLRICYECLQYRDDIDDGACKSCW